MKAISKHKYLLINPAPSRCWIKFLALILFFEIIIIIAKQPANFSSKIPLREAYTACLNNTEESKEKGMCLRKLAKDVLKDHSTKEVESVMLTLNDSNQRQWCHEFMHYVGWGLYQKTQGLYEAFTLASDKCDSGMYHGVAEKYIETTQIGYSPKDFVENVIPNSCEKGFPTRNLPVAMKGHCYHGLGHAFMFITDNDLNQSLQYCDHVLVGYENSCYTGALMENLQSKQVGRLGTHVSKFSFDLNNPDYPCSNLNQKYKDYCYRYKGVSNILFTNANVKQSVQECLKVAPLYQNQCFWGIGSNLPGPQWSSRTAGEKCNEALEINPQAYKQCILGAMAFLMQLNLGNADEAVAFCDAIKEDYKPICYSAAGKNLVGWITSEESLEEKCRYFENSEAERICLHPEKMSTE